jgi:hypothetical protein
LLIPNFEALHASRPFSEELDVVAYVSCCGDGMLQRLLVWLLQQQRRASCAVAAGKKGDSLFETENRF